MHRHTHHVHRPRVARVTPTRNDEPEDDTDEDEALWGFDEDDLYHTGTEDE